MTRLLLTLLALLVILIAFVYFVGRSLGRNRAIEDVAKTFGDKLLTADGDRPVEMELAVWGESEANADGAARQEIIARLHEGDPLELVRRSSSAEEVIAVVSEKGEIGRLTHGDAAMIAPYLNRGGRIQAQVSGIRGGSKDQPDLNVWIVVRPVD
jgi:hypothetical protein